MGRKHHRHSISHRKHKRGKHGNRDSDRKLDPASNATRIAELLAMDPVSLKDLRELCWKGDGLVNAFYRRCTWPLILRLDSFELEPLAHDPMLHPEAEQVRRDVDRSLWKFTRNMQDSERQHLRDKLYRMVLVLLSRHPDWHYFQGLHDLCSVVMLVFEKDDLLCDKAIHRICETWLADCFLSDFSEVNLWLQCLMPILEKACPPIFEIIKATEMQPYFGISWILTWWVYRIDDVDTCARVFDCFLSDHPLCSLYMGAQLILDHANEVNANADFAELHAFFASLTIENPSQIPSSFLNQSLWKEFPPKQLLRSSTLAPSSVCRQWPPLWWCDYSNGESDKANPTLKAQLLMWSLAASISTLTYLVVTASQSSV